MNLEADLDHGVYLRLLTPDDAGRRAQFLQKNAAFLTPFMPPLDARLFEVKTQQALLTQFSQEQSQGLRYPWGIFSQNNDLIGWVNLNNVVRGAFYSADIGYVMDGEWTRKGIMTRAVDAVVRMAFERIGLHRVQAAIMPGNYASIGVITRNRFVFIGLAQEYLYINGQWQDHQLYARINSQWTPV